MRSRRPRIALVWLAAGLSAMLLGLWTWSARAGGNIQFRNPANLSEVFDRTWDDRMLPITWVLSEDGLPGTGIDNATIIAELTAAYDTWESLTTSKLDFEFGGEVPIRTTGLDGPLGPGIDGVNLITFTDPDLLFPPGVLAVSIAFAFPTDTVIDSSNSDLDGDAVPDIPEGTYLAGTIFDNDIAFNSSEPWATSGVNGTFDIRAVGLHEIGHGFGLAHSSIPGAVMWPFLDNDIAAARTAKTDDIAYASFYYPEEPAYSSPSWWVPTAGTTAATCSPGWPRATFWSASSRSTATPRRSIPRASTRSSCSPSTRTSPRSCTTPTSRTSRPTRPPALRCR
jgi:hypothetical protein